MRKSLLLFFIAFLLPSSLWAGGPWTPAKGKGYFKLSEWWIIFDKHYTDAGLTDPNVTTGIFNTALYADYGLSNRLAATLYFPFLSRTYMNDLVSFTTGNVLVKGEAINAIGDMDIQLKYRLTKNEASIPVSASLLLGLPTGQTSGGTQGNLQTGDGEFNQLLELHAGKGFNISGKNAYCSISAGFNNRTNGYSDEIRYSSELGISWLNNKLWTIFRINAVESLKNGLTSPSATSTSIFANNSEFLSPSIEVAYYFKKQWGVSASAAGAVRGEIIAASPSYSVGLFYDMGK